MILELCPIRAAALAFTGFLLIGADVQATAVTQFQDGVHGRSQRLATPTSTGFFDDIGPGQFGSRTASASANFVDRSDQVMRFDYFDASLGTLERVTISYGLTAFGTNRVYVDDFTCAIFGAGDCLGTGSGAAIPTFARATGSVGYGIEIEPYVPTSVGAPTTGLENPNELEVRTRREVSATAGQGETDSNGLNATSAPSILELTGAQAANFVGTGQYDIMPLFVSALEIEARCGGITVAQVTSCSADGRVTYNVGYRVGVIYEYSEVVAPAPVPLPAGALLLLSGLLGVAGLRRFRKA